MSTNPQTGTRALYVSELQTDRIEGLPLAESDQLLQELFGYLYAPDNVYEHWWHEGDLVVWDNFAVQHGRRDLADVGRRTLQRAVIGEKTLFEQCPQMRYVDGEPILGAGPGAGES